MIEPATASEILASLQRVEDRLNRLLISGWRQAGAEAAEFQAEAEMLAESGLPELAVRIGNVARATDARSALAATALAASACQLLRLRLGTPEPPIGWQTIPPLRRRSSATNDTLVPLARIHLNGDDAWICAWPARHQAVILVAPPHLPTPTEPAPAPEGFLGRLQRGVRQTFGDPPADPSPWLRRRLRGSLRWEGRLPIGTQHDLALCTLEDPAWVTEPQDDHADHRQFVASLSAERIRKGGMMGWYGVPVMVAEVERARAAQFDWVDSSMAVALESAPHPRMPAVWVNAHPLTFPVALLELGPMTKIVHLVPGLPSERLATD